MKIKHVHTKTAKGRTYLYYDTGARNAKGRPILTALGSADDPRFGRKLADAQSARTKRQRPVPQAMTIRRLADLFEKSDKFRQFAAGTQRAYGIYLDLLRDQIGPAVAAEFTAEDAQVLLDSMADRPGAGNLAIGTLGALYKWARTRGHVPKSAKPTMDLELLEVGEHEPWPDWLLTEALTTDQPLVRYSSALLYFTAQRIGDVVAMHWTSLAGGRVKVRQEKTDTELDFAQHSALAAILGTIPKIGMTVLAKPNGRPYAASTVRKVLQAWAKERGVDVVPHGLRKNAVNALLEAGCSTWEVQAISGQSPAVIEHYAKRRNRSRLGDSAVLKWGRNAS